MKTNTVLLDGDYIAYKGAAGRDEQPLNEVLDLLDDEMNFVLSNCKEAFGDKSLEYITFFSSPKNTRKEKYPDYKANRKDPKPAHYKSALLHMQAFWNGVVVEGIEADDAIGICAHYLPTEDTIIATADKDFAQMRNIWVYDIYPMRAEIPRKEGQPYIEKELTEDGVWYRTSDKSALKQLAYQLIYGDSGDSVKGLTQYNGKKARHKKTAFTELCATLDTVGWEQFEVIKHTQELYCREFGDEEGKALFKKVFQLVYIHEIYCDEFLEIPKTKKYK